MVNYPNTVQSSWLHFLLYSPYFLQLNHTLEGEGTGYHTGFLQEWRLQLAS